MPIIKKGKNENSAAPAAPVSSIGVLLLDCPIHASASWIASR
jgi:hypothetical protein